MNRRLRLARNQNNMTERPAEVDAVLNSLNLLHMYTHRLQDQLAVIVGRCELALSQGATKPEMASQLEEIRKAARTAANLTQRIQNLKD